MCTNQVRKQYAAVLVIGVGPFRTTNYMFNRPVFKHEHLSAKEKRILYEPLLSDGNDDASKQMCDFIKSLFMVAK